MLLGHVSVSNVSAERAPDSDVYRLLVRCAYCADNHRRCNKEFPCQHCSKAGVPCLPSVDEVYRRGVDVDAAIRKREIVVGDLGLYILNTEAIRMRQKTFLKREEQLEILERLRVEFPLMPRECCNVRPVMEELPVIIQDLVRGQDLWKVEWNLRGMALPQMSMAWRNELMVPRWKMSGKICEQLGFYDWRAVMRLWGLSLSYLDQVVYYEGRAKQHRRGDVFQKVRMISHVYDHDHVVTGLVVEVLDSVEGGGGAPRVT